MLSELQERWVQEAAESDLGLWWLADDVRERMGAGAAEGEVREQTLELLKPLLETRQLRAVSLLPGGGFEVWHGTVEETVEQIRKQWCRLTEQPNIGEVVWFIGDRAEL